MTSSKILVLKSAPTLLSICFIVVAPFLLNGCKATKSRLATQKNTLLKSSHFGLQVADLESGKVLESYQDDKYFIPASNTKIYTLYAGIKSAPDSLPGIRYAVRNDTLFFSGTGDPSLFHPDLPVSSVVGFLRNRKEHLVWTDQNHREPRFGPGWAWDDYNDYYQPEKSTLPIAGNVVRFTGDSLSRDGYRIFPEFWRDSVTVDASAIKLYRDEFRNLFHMPRNSRLPHGTVRDIPVSNAHRLTPAILSHLLEKKVSSTATFQGRLDRQVRSIPSDTAFRLMMINSDNFIAEQTMLVYAYGQKLPLNSSLAIKSAIDTLYRDLTDTPLWKDGSGLSRYNLFTPRITVQTLRKLSGKLPESNLLRLFPKAGEQGTLRNMFQNQAQLIYAKTGSMSNVFCLSGFIRGKSGKLLVFSAMHNNFARPMSEIRKETERLLSEIAARH